MVPLIRLGARLRRWAMAVLRIETHGVKVLVRDPAGRVLLLRNTYGKRHLWTLPGGGVGRRESPAEAARREVREECGCGIDAPVFFARYRSTLEGRRDTIDLFTAQTADEPRADRREVAEARFFAPDALPPDCSAATRRRLAEVLDGAAAAAEW